MDFSEKLRDLLSRKGVTWKQVSEELAIGKNQLKYWQDKNTLPDGKTLLKLSEYLNVSTDYLLGKTTFNPGDVVEVNLNLKKDLGHGETRFIHSMEHHNIARNMLNSIVVDPQEQMLLDIFRNTSEEGKLRMIQSIMNIHDEIEKKSALSNTAHNE